MEKYRVTLTREERDELMEIINKGKHIFQKFRNAYILLNCDRGEYGDPGINEQISNVLKVGMRTIDRVKKRFVEQRFDQALQRNASMLARSMGMWKPIWWRYRATSHRKAMPTGACACWPTGWSS